ncbi:MAG: holo-ACP synthase [Actinomycetia bacterium]|nr:holo-ACP synthase [Actinomycetes bacterium]
MILGTGVDVCDLARWQAMCRRRPGAAARVLCPYELALPARSQAARFAAKEALAKALGAPAGLSWHDAEVVTDPAGRPVFEVRGSVAERLAALGAARIHLSLSHDGGLAVAMVVVESR